MTLMKVTIATVAMALMALPAHANRGGKSGKKSSQTREQREQKERDTKENRPGMTAASGKSSAQVQTSARVQMFTSKLTGEARARANNNLNRYFEQGTKEGLSVEKFLVSFERVNEGEAKDLIRTLVTESAARDAQVFEVSGVTAEVNGRYDLFGWFSQISGMLEGGKEMPASLKVAIESMVGNLNKGQTAVDALRNAITKDGKETAEWERFLRACPFKL